MRNVEGTEGWSPVTTLECDFLQYVRMKKEHENLHLDGNAIPDYAFGLDYELRKKLDSIPRLYSISRKMMATHVSRTIQEVNRDALAVGPNQMPDVYEIACDCARTLGIGVPNVYIYPSTEINALTMACDDVEPLIVIYSALYERFKGDTLRAVIGHECGHIQNAHGTYMTVGSLLLNGGMGLIGSIPGVAQLAGLLTSGTRILLHHWSRAAEVTADRASVICSSPEAAIRAQVIFMYGGAFNVDADEINIDAIQEQLEMQMSNIVKYGELLEGKAHPTTARRIAALRAFSECEVLYGWRPELKTAGQVCRSREETEELCRKVIDIMEKK